MTPLLRTTLILALLTLPMAAQPAPAPRPGAGQLNGGLGLTEAQRTRIQAIREKFRPDLIHRRDTMMHARIDLRTALRDASTPEAQLRTLYDKAAAARFDAILARRSLRLEVQAVLTPEQRAKAAEWRRHAWRRMGGRLQRPPRDGGMAG